MKALKFKEQNCTFAKDQHQYKKLPAHRVDEPEGRVIFCMGLSFWERVRVLLFGKIWCSLMMFNKPLTPSHFTTKKSDYFNKQWSWLGILNYCILQWFFIRLAKHYDNDKIVALSIMYFPIPLTGWDNNYKFLNKKMRFFYIKKFK